MTTKLPPGCPALELDGDPQDGEGDVIADSSWEGMEDPEDQAAANLGRIARTRRKPASGSNSAKG